MNQDNHLIKDCIYSKKEGIDSNRALRERVCLPWKEAQRCRDPSIYPQSHESQWIWTAIYHYNKNNLSSSRGELTNQIQCFKIAKRLQIQRIGRHSISPQKMSFSGGIVLADLDDYISPSPKSIHALEWYTER